MITLEEERKKMEKILLLMLPYWTPVIPPAGLSCLKAYLSRYVLGKEVFLRFDGEKPRASGEIAAYVYLKNRIFINAHLIKSGLAILEPGVEHALKARFMALRPT